MNRKAIIEQKLSVINPHFLKVIDKSAIHAGHVGNPQGGAGSHFIIEIAAKILENQPMIRQHRVIYNLLKEEFDNGLHSLTIKVHVPNL